METGSAGGRRYGLIIQGVLVFIAEDCDILIRHWEVPFGIPQCVQYILHGLVYKCPPLNPLSLLAAKSVDSVVACDGFLCLMEIVCSFFCQTHFQSPWNLVG